MGRCGESGPDYRCHQGVLVSDRIRFSPRHHLMDPVRQFPSRRGVNIDLRYDCLMEFSKPTLDIFSPFCGPVMPYIIAPELGRLRETGQRCVSTGLDAICRATGIGLPYRRAANEVSIFRDPSCCAAFS
jgi:hypothetical protein